MLVLTIIPVVTVNAESYIADDTYIMSSQYHDFFRNYFGENVSYQYFTYKCNYNDYNRNCYYGIDKNNNYVKIEYQANGSYNYNQIITTGVDENFSVTGNNVFKVPINNNRIILYGLVFVFVIFILLLLMGRL